MAEYDEAIREAVKSDREALAKMMEEAAGSLLKYAQGHNPSANAFDEAARMIRERPLP